MALYVSTEFRPEVPEGDARPAPPTRSSASRRQGDGWYWFTVQTRDADGRFYPPDMSLAQPAHQGVRGHPPADDFLLPLLSPQNGQVGVEWEVIDPNLDPTTLRVDYRPANSDWMPLPVKQAASGQYYWNAGTNRPIEARLQVQDKAHNPAESRATPGNGGFKVGSNPAPTPGYVPPPPPARPTRRRQRHHGQHQEHSTRLRHRGGRFFQGEVGRGVVHAGRPHLAEDAGRRQAGAALRRAGAEPRGVTASR